MKRHMMDDLLLKGAKLDDRQLTVASSDDDIDKILFEAFYQLDTLSPSTPKKPKIDSKKVTDLLQ